MMQAFTATSQEGQNFENQRDDEIPDTKNKTFNLVEEKSNEEKLSITPTSATGMKSPSSNFTYAFSTSSSKVAGASMSFSTSKNYNSGNFESKASTLSKSTSVCSIEDDCQGSHDPYSEKLDPNWGTANSGARLWEQEEEGTNTFHTMVQALTATSHEGQNFEIQPKDEFPDIETDGDSLEEATSIREELSKTSTVSTAKRSFFSRVKRIVSKPSSKFESDSLAFTRSKDNMAASEIECEFSSSSSQSNWRSVNVSEYESQDHQEDSCDTSSYRINPNWEVDSSHASTWNEFDHTSFQCSIGRECLSTIYQGESFRRRTMIQKPLGAMEVPFPAYP